MRQALDSAGRRACGRPSDSWGSGLGVRVGAADCAIVKSMHRSSSCEARNPGSCENPSWPQLDLLSGDPNAGISFDSEGVYARCHSAFMAGVSQGRHAGVSGMGEIRGCPHATFVPHLQTKRVEIKNQVENTPFKSIQMARKSGQNM